MVSAVTGSPAARPRSPLRHRLPRQLRANAGRWAAILVLLLAVSATGTGYLSATASLSRITHTLRADYAVEDGRITTAAELTDEQSRVLSDAGLEMHDNRSRDTPLVIDAAHLADGEDPDATVTLRLHTPRDGFDLEALHEGAMPAADDELALDATFARAHRLGVGDTVTAAGTSWTICGIVTLPDYTALFQKNSGIVMNTLTFGVGTVTPGGWERLGSADGVPTAFTASFFLDDELSADTAARVGLDGSALTDGDGTLTAGERRDVETDAAARLVAAGARVTSLIDADDNMGITYGTDDVDHDSAFITWLLVVLLVVVAFIVTVISSATIESESSVIGTLLASGWRRGELLRHYLALPALVGATACLAGNILGHTVLTAPMRSIYYAMYSLPPCETSFSLRALLLTMVLPLVLLIGITALGLLRALHRTPLQFLRHEHRRRGHRAVHLPARLPFRTRFRLRLLLQARAAFATLFAGIVLSSFLLMAGLSFLPIVDNYTEDTIADLPAAYTYALSAPVDPADAGPDPDAGASAERITTTVLRVERRWDAGPMDVQLLGIDTDSPHLGGLDVADGRVVVGAGLLDKTDVRVGDELTLTDRYTGTQYRLTVAGTWGNSTDVRVYLSRAELNGMLGEAPGSFNGYLSDGALDLPSEAVASVTTEQDVRTAADQVSASASSVLRMAAVLAVLVFVIVVHLLTKTIIDRGARTISLLKVLGHRDGEVSAVYVRTVTLTVAASLLVSPLLVIRFLTWGVARVFIGYDANFVLAVPPAMVAEELAVALGAYLLVAALHLLHVRRIPPGEALRVQE